MSVTTSGVPAAWPTGDDVTRALHELGRGVEQVDELAMELSRLVDVEIGPSVVEGAPRPSLSTLGSITTFVACVELDRGVLDATLRKLREIRDGVGLEPGMLPEVDDAS
jgi:hypothetical protein